MLSPFEVSHHLPVKPFIQSQLAKFAWISQLAPFLQGFGVHAFSVWVVDSTAVVCSPAMLTGSANDTTLVSSLAVSQSFPMNPSIQEQLPSLQVPPFLHMLAPPD